MRPRITVPLPALLLAAVATAVAAAQPPVAVRFENLPVPPATGPVAYVAVRNLGDKPFEGTVRIELPTGWKANRLEAKLALKPRETQRVPFAIEHAKGDKANRYPLRVTVTGPGGTLTRQQTVVCASAPHFKPAIDGRTSDWKDAIPVTVTHKGKNTVVHTYWNRRQFCVLFEVEEDKMVGYRTRPGPDGFDAVQLAIAPAKARTPVEPTGKAARYEFLLVPSASSWVRDKAFLLLKAGDSLAQVRQAAPLAPLQTSDVSLKVRRRGGKTIYECALPWSLMPTMKPKVGREIRFSFLIHDPDGDGLRDWGEAAGLWPSQRTWLAWRNWAGARWPKQPPFDGKIEWGLCTSKY